MALEAPPRPRGIPLAWFGRVPPELAFAVRFATAVAAALWIAHAPGLVTNQAQWIFITVATVAGPAAGGAIAKGALRMLGTVAGAVLSIALYGWFAQDPPLLLLGLFVVQIAGAWGFSGSRHAYAWFVFALTTAIILADAIAGSGAVETVAFQRATMVGIGIAIVVLTDSLLWPAAADDGPAASAAPPGEHEPLRVHIALRGGLASCTALLAVVVLGWPMNALVAPVAFMVATLPSPAKVSKTLLVMAASVLGSWAVADLALVFVHPRLGEMPAALVWPALLAGGLAWVSARNPALGAVRTLGSILAILPVFAGEAAPTSVYGPYNVATYFALALGIGWASTRVFWPVSEAPRRGTSEPRSRVSSENAA